MNPVIRVFESRGDLEVAYRAGELKLAETYRVKNSRYQYRLSAVRKGLVEIPVSSAEEKQHV